MKSQRLEQVDRELMLRAAHARASRNNKRGIPLWSFVGDICGVGSTSAGQICDELGWDCNAKAESPLPPWRTQ